MRHLKGVPKTHVYRIIPQRRVRINKGRAAADARVRENDRCACRPCACPTRWPRGQSAPPAREFPALLLEDDHLIAIDKPPGTAVRSGSGVRFGVIEQLRRARPQAKFWNWCTRLDREPRASCWWPKRSALTHLQDQFHCGTRAKPTQRAGRRRRPEQER